MRFIKKSERSHPKVSLVLLDWGVRESFHFLDYLNKQAIDRDLFEVIFIEYYSKVSPNLVKKLDEVDTLVVLEMPRGCYYHKHLMYNVGIVYAKGEIIVICDSDAMAKESFLQTIISAFDENPNIILHLDQFRNSRNDLYPFRYPSFEEVSGDGCINNAGDMTTGVATEEDPIHNRNYGACMCARRDDLIAIGGADEHVDYVGHMCGPYDMTFRLKQYGKKEIWHRSEFLYHTWHPGQAGENNYQGPHDGRHMSTTSLEVFVSQRIKPHVMNAAIAYLQSSTPVDQCQLDKRVIMPEYQFLLSANNIKNGGLRQRALKTYRYVEHRGFIIEKISEKKYVAYLAIEKCFSKAPLKEAKKINLSGETLADVQKNINKLLKKDRHLLLFASSVLFVRRFLRYVCLNPLKTAIFPLIKWCGELKRAIEKPFKRKAGQFFLEYKNLNLGLASLIVNLRFLKKNKSASMADRENIEMLITESRYENYILKLFMKLNLIRKIQIVNLMKNNKFDELFLTLNTQKAAGKKILISRNVLKRYLDFFIEAGFDQILFTI